MKRNVNENVLRTIDTDEGAVEALREFFREYYLSGGLDKSRARPEAEITRSWEIRKGRLEIDLEAKKLLSFESRVQEHSIKLVEMQNMLNFLYARFESDKARYNLYWSTRENK